jgi:hypothetical protein
MVCEAFHCVPSVACREIDESPMGLLETILRYRGYAAAKRDYEAACRRKDEEAKSDPRFVEVMVHEFEIVDARRQAGPSEPKA